MVNEGVVFAHIEQTEDRARFEADNYRLDSRNRGAWSVRVYRRAVRAGGAVIPCWAVVVREKAVKP